MRLLAQIDIFMKNSRLGGVASAEGLHSLIRRTNPHLRPTLSLVLGHGVAWSYKKERCTPLAIPTLEDTCPCIF